MYLNIIFIERLALVSVIKVLLTRRKYWGKSKSVAYYVESVVGFNKFYRLFLNLFFVSVRKIDFRYEYLVDELGTDLGLKIVHEDLNKILLEIYDSDYFQIGNGENNDEVIKIYIGKKITTDSWLEYDHKTLLQILLMFHAVSQFAKKVDSKGNVIFFVEKRAWMNELASYVSDLDIELIPYKFSMKDLKQRLITFLKKNKNIRSIKTSLDYKFSKNRDFHKSIKHNNIGDEPKVIIDQIMQMYGVDTIWSSSRELTPGNVIFVSKSHKIGQKEFCDIKNAGMNFISLAPGIAEGLNVPLYLPEYVKLANKIPYIKNRNDNLDGKIVNQYTKEFVFEKRYWSDLFNRVGAKIYVTSHKWSSHPVAASAAMLDTGGISALFQSSYSEFPCPYASVYSDLFFSFSTKTQNVEKKNGSLIKYNICVGYIGKSRNKSLRGYAKELRKKLQNQGAEKIVSFFDQNVDAQSNFTFWFEKILEVDWLGLVIKPKNPGTLRENLGEVSKLMDKAIATGRCHIFLDSEPFHVKNFKNPPAEAAMASDIAIHDDLASGTAGIEAALTGTPTLMFDNNGWDRSQIYNLGVGKVVFNDWETLWDALIDHWKKKQIPGFGDWSPILNDLDPFQDGKAAHRMTTYLIWLLEGFKQGISRNTILAEAAERFAQEWGADKIYLGNNTTVTKKNA